MPRSGVMILNRDVFRNYIDGFNENDEELYAQQISNKSAWLWIKENVPFFDITVPGHSETCRKIAFILWAVFA